MRKFFIIFPIIVVIILALVACGQEDEPSYEVNMSVFMGPSALGALDLMARSDQNETINSYNFQILGTPDQVPPLIMQGAVDIAAVPSNMASILYNNTGGEVVVLAASTLGLLHIIDTTDTINSIADLAGQTVFLTGYGATPHFVANHILAQNGLEVGVDVFLDFRAEPPEIAALMNQGVAEIAIVPEPFATTLANQIDNARHALDLTHEWNLIEGESSLIMTAIIARREFAENNPQAIEIFLQEYAESVEFLSQNLTQAAELAVYYGIIPNEAIATQAIPRTNQVFITGTDLRTQLLGYLEVLYNELPAFIGGNLPSDNFFY